MHGFLPDAIISQIDKRQNEQLPRNGIGASAIGTECDAYLAFELRGFPSSGFSPSTHRLFRLGHAIETIVEDEIAAAMPMDYTVSFTDTDGNQFKVPVHGGHSWSTLDGVIKTPTGDIIVVEIKSMSDASFSKFKLAGVRESHPRYFSQVQKQMHDAGSTQCLVVAYNKNTSELHAEMVDYDMVVAAALDARIELAMTAQARKKGDSRNSMACKFCNRRSQCWDGPDSIEMNCRTCTKAVATDAGTWFCTMRNCVANPQTCADWSLYQPLEKA